MAIVDDFSASARAALRTAVREGVGQWVRTTVTTAVCVAGVAYCGYRIGKWLKAAGGSHCILGPFTSCRVLSVGFPISQAL